MSRSRSTRSHSRPLETGRCVVSGRDWPLRDLFPVAMLRPAIAERLREEIGDYPADAMISRPELDRLRTAHIADLLRQERGELTALEREVVDSLERHDILAGNVRRRGIAVRLCRAVEGKQRAGGTEGIDGVARGAIPSQPVLERDGPVVAELVVDVERGIRNVCLGFSSAVVAILTQCEPCDAFARCIRSAGRCSEEWILLTRHALAGAESGGARQTAGGLREL